MIFSHRIDLRVILRHVAFWIAYILYKALHEVWIDKDVLSFHLVPQFLTDIPVSIILAYLNLYLLMPLFYYPQHYVKYIVALILLMLAGGFAARYFTYVIWVPWDKLHDPEMYRIENKDFFIPVRILRNAVEAYPVVAVSMLIRLMRRANKQERHLREIEKGKYTAEMGLLKAQINPHFFFNTLNSVYALALKRSELTASIVLRLSDLMHYMLYEANDEHVLLTAEIKHLEHYIGIEQMRFADRLDLSFQYSGDIEGKIIAPLLLLPFVENAFKHGIEDNAGWITISLKVSGRQLFLKVENSYQPLTQIKGEGLGLPNVRRRLELVYPGQHELNIRQNHETYEVELKLQL